MFKTTVRQDNEEITLIHDKKFYPNNSLKAK